MPLPYPTKVVLPFDIATAQDMNERHANDVALANGTGLDAGAITNAKLSTATGEPGAAWQTWTPTVTGFSGTPTVTAKYTRIGKTVTLFISALGTSNATSKFFTLPTAAVANNDEYFGMSSNSDAGTNYIGATVYRSATPNIQVYRGINGSTGSGTQFTSWTASGTVSFAIRFTYEAA